MKLKHHPLAIFQNSDTPLALHVRQKWINPSSRDQHTADSLRDRLQSAQQSDGSWGGSVATTIENLFAVWLLGTVDAATERAVNWLMETDQPPLRRVNKDGGRYDDMFFHTPARDDRKRLRQLRGVPSTPGCAGFVKTGAALFHALELRQGDAARITRACQTLSHLFVYRHGRPCTGSCNVSLLMAMAVDCRRFDPQAIAAAIGWLQRQQQPGGSWAKGIPFFETVYALHRFPQKLAAAQLDRALAYAATMQRRNGGWGRTDQQLKTFLLLPALHQAAGIGPTIGTCVRHS